MNWIKDAGLKLPDAPEESEIPEITEIDELQTFVGQKKNKVGLWTEVNHWKPGIILWTLLRSQHRIISKFYGRLYGAGAVFPKGYRFAYGMLRGRECVLVV